METLEDMFEHNLKEMYYVENRLVGMLDEHATSASNDRLQQGFEEHREETREHVENLEAAFDAVGITPEEQESLLVEALADERERFHEMATDDQLQDLYDMMAAMKTERMEITAYEGLLTLADKLDYGDDVKDPLEDNLSEERSTLRELEAMSKGSKFKAILGQLLS